MTISFGSVILTYLVIGIIITILLRKYDWSSNSLTVGETLFWMLVTTICWPLAIIYELFEKNSALNEWFGQIEYKRLYLEKPKKSNQGFTVIELMIVVIIATVGIGVILPEMLKPIPRDAFPAPKGYRSLIIEGHTYYQNIFHPEKPLTHSPECEARDK